MVFVNIEYVYEYDRLPGDDVTENIEKGPPGAMFADDLMVSSTTSEEVQIEDLDT